MNASGGSSVHEAAGLLAAASCCRAWRQAALEMLRLCLQIRAPAELGHPILLALPCTELRLPLLDDCLAPEQRTAAEAAMLRLLASPSFRSRTCLEALAGVPLPVSASGVLASLPALRRLELVDSFPGEELWSGAAGVTRACFPGGLACLHLPARLLLAGAARNVPPGLHRLQARSPRDLVLTGQALRAAPRVGACAGRTATILLEGFQVPSRCADLCIHARNVVFSTAEPAWYDTFIAHVATHLPPAGSALAPTALAAACLQMVAPLADAAGLRRLELAAHSFSLYCRSTGRLHSLTAPTWQQPCARRAEGRCGWQTELCWPVPQQPPSYFSFTISRPA